MLFAAHAGTFLFRFASVEDLLAARAESVDLDMPPYGIAVDEEKIYVVLPDGSDPNTQPVLMSTPSWDETGSEEFLLMVAGSPTSSSTASCFGARGPTAC